MATGRIVARNTEGDSRASPYSDSGIVGLLRGERAVLRPWQLVMWAVLKSPSSTPGARSIHGKVHPAEAGLVGPSLPGVEQALSILPDVGVGHAGIYAQHSVSRTTSVECVTIHALSEVQVMIASIQAVSC